jgi:hypothetical protein
MLKRFEEESIVPHLPQHAKMSLLRSRLVNHLLHTFKFDGDAFEVLALDEGALGGVGVNAEATLPIFFLSLVDVALLRLLCFELFLNHTLINFTMLGLTCDECGGGFVELIVNLLGKLQKERGLLIHFQVKGVEGVSKLTSTRRQHQEGRGGI